MDFLSQYFQAEGDWSVFCASHRHFYPKSDCGRVEWLLVKTFEDCLNGASLPPFVLAAYHEIKYGR
jgi:hypothetical protein